MNLYRFPCFSWHYIFSIYFLFMGNASVNSDNMPLCGHIFLFLLIRGHKVKWLLCGKILFNLLENCQNVFQSVCTMLYSHQQCIVGLLSLHPQTLIPFVFFILAILVDMLEKVMAPHSSTLAWKIPCMEKPGGLQSMGLLRVRHD